MKRGTLLLTALALVLGGAGRAKAGTITFVLPDVDASAGYWDYNTADTFSGTGFVGIYPPTEGTPAFAHLFGLENYGAVYSETELEANVGVLHGAVITSAILSYTLVNGGSSSQTVTATSFDANGTLSYATAPPNNLGSTTFTSNGQTSNSVDVTGLLNARLAAGKSWFGLYLTPNGNVGQNAYQWTYTSAEFGGNADAADVRLTVDFTTSAPNPAASPSSPSGPSDWSDVCGGAGRRPASREGGLLSEPEA